MTTTSRPNRSVLRAGAHAQQMHWALATLLVVIVVLGATLGLHSFVGRARRATLVTPAPLGPLRVAAVTAPGISYEHIALDASAGHLIALAGSVPRGCPPTGACALGSVATAFAVLDGATGAPIASVPLAGPSGSAANATMLLADPTTHTAYAVAPSTVTPSTVTPSTVTRFSTIDGHYEGGFALPATLGTPLNGGALDVAHQTLALAGSATLALVNADSGAVRASSALPHLAAGPVLDAASGRLLVLAGSSASGGTTTTMTLMAFDAATLTPQGQLTVPAGPLGPLGPLGAANHALLLFGADGTDYRIALDGPLALSAVTAAPELRYSPAAGWNATLGHTYLATPAALEARDMTNGAILGTLPVTALQAAAQPLAVDATRGLLYLPTTDGAVVIVHDAPASGINAATALLLARAALVHFLPDTNQDPPFVAPETFPVAADPTAAGVAHDFWVHFSDLGWQGPYPGGVGASVAPNSQHAGGYLVSFHIAWYQLFARSHTWVCSVAADGTVALQSDTGDAVP